MWKDLWSKWNGECPLLKQGGSSEPDESSCSCFWKFVNFLFNLNPGNLFAISRNTRCWSSLSRFSFLSRSTEIERKTNSSCLESWNRLLVGPCLAHFWALYYFQFFFGIFKSKWLFLALFHALFLNPFFGRGQGGQMGQSDGREQREWSRQLQWFLYKNHPPFPWVKKITIAIVYDLPPKIWNTSHRQYFSIWLNIFLQDNWKICLFYDNNILKCGVLS